MSLPEYPVAADGHAALAALRAGDKRRAAREREAEIAAGEAVAFVTESIGPLYATEAEAQQAYVGVLTDHGVCILTCRIAEPPAKRYKPTQPVYEDGVRWPKVDQSRRTVWQISISYWKILPASRTASAAAPNGQARKLRKTARGYDLTPEEILALTETPMAASRPQKALDFGLFDFIPPDNPGIVIADE